MSNYDYRPELDLVQPKVPSSSPAEAALKAPLPPDSQISAHGQVAKVMTWSDGNRHPNSPAC